MKIAALDVHLGNHKCLFPLVNTDLNVANLLWCRRQLSVRGKNNQEKVLGFWKSVTQSADEVLLSNQRDKDDFFEHQRTFLVEYHLRIRDATGKADRMTKSHKSEGFVDFCGHRIANQNR